MCRERLPRTASDATTDANHRLANRDPIRIDVTVGLWIDFSYPVVNRGSTPLDTQPLEVLFGIRERRASEMELYTRSNRELKCLFSLHEPQVNPLGISAETVEFGD